MCFFKILARSKALQEKDNILSRMTTLLTRARKHLATKQVSGHVA